MRLLASGRESDILDVGGGRVLRRYKQGGNPEHEALVMAHAQAHGFPVPRVLEVHPGELVLERMEGPNLVSDLARRPWRLRAHARLLTDLHRRLHRIEAPPGLEAASDGDALLQLDLHPENVLLTTSGPVVIDWTNARRGDPAFDVAYT
jgi:streptomycin 6-kinase